MERLPPLLRIPSIEEVRRRAPGEDQAGDRGQPRRPPAPQDEAQDQVDERTAMLADLLSEDEASEATQPLPERSLADARSALVRQPMLAREAQGEGVDRGNAVKIL